MQMHHLRQLHPRRGGEDRGVLNGLDFVMIRVFKVNTNEKSAGDNHRKRIWGERVIERVASSAHPCG